VPGIGHHRLRHEVVEQRSGSPPPSPMTDEERQQLLARTAPYAKGGKWEKFKTTGMFDGTEQHKQWLTSARL
jgi:hypothetical protein